jgi:large subunit ribosomal protein LP0
MKDYKYLLICDIRNMPAHDIHIIRKEIRVIDSDMICGKSTVIQKAIGDLIETKKIPSHYNKEILLEISDILKNIQLCMIFTNGDVSAISALLTKFKIIKDGKHGAISPIEVTIPAGPTGMDASQIEYFQNLKIPTKVVKNQLEITAPTRILNIGSKMTISEVNLMKKFGIKPFSFKIEILHIVFGAKLYNKDILKINDEYLKEKVLKGITNVAAFGLATNISNKASAPHQIAKCFANWTGLSSVCGVNLKQVKLGQGAAPAEKKEAEKKEVEKKEVEKKDDKKGADKGGDKGGDKKGGDKKGGDKGGKKEDTKKKEKEPEPEDEGQFAGDMFNF